jgi:DNA polymerase-3 subunit gamma/tau
VQLLYQIALHGKRDLPWAADPKSGFDMTLLRMLSFQPNTSKLNIENPPVKKSQPANKPAVTQPPVNVGNVNNTDTKEPQTSAPLAGEVVNHSNANASVLTSPASQQKPEALPEANLTTPKLKQEQKPQSSSDIPVNEQFKEEEVADSLPSVSEDTLISVDLSPANWTQIISELKLSALTRQLAENSAFIRCEERTLQLSLSPELAHLATTKSKERLEQALQQKLDQNVSVTFNHDTGSMHSGPTVAVERAEQLAQKQQQAIESIQTDPTIEVIKNTFNARVVESTIKPLD